MTFQAVELFVILIIRGRHHMYIGCSSSLVGLPSFGGQDARNHSWIIFAVFHYRPRKSRELCSERLAHRWLDGFWKPYAWCLLVSATHDNYLGQCSFGIYHSLLVIRHPVRTYDPLSYSQSSHWPILSVRTKVIFPRIAVLTVRQNEKTRARIYNHQIV